MMLEYAGCSDSPTPDAAVAVVLTRSQAPRVPLGKGLGTWKPTTIHGPAGAAKTQRKQARRKWAVCFQTSFFIAMVADETHDLS